jgi:sulfotransferase family protein
MRGIFPAQDVMLQRARALLRAEEVKGVQALVPGKIEDIRRFDVAGMDRAVAIIACGRSGAELVASFLDGHDDVVMLPTLQGDRIYQFFERYESLSLHDKLIAYPVFSADIIHSDFFQGAFPISAAGYYAAVKALFEVYGNSDSGFLESRRAFFRFLHVVYCVALGRRTASPQPLMVYPQHGWNDELARRLLEDFPQAQFIHTVRDPITNCGRFFDYRSEMTGLYRKPALIPAYVIWNLSQRDVPHRGMESRTFAVRFEDLHLQPEATMRAVADRLGLPYRASLLESTFNGVPWVVQRGTNSWSGARPEQAVRDSRNISHTDQGLLFALLHEGFVAWNYPCPKIFKHALVRALTCALVLIIPMKMEIIAARRFIQKVPSLREGGLRHAIKGSVQILICRFSIMSLVMVNLCRRLAFRRGATRLSIIKVPEAPGSAAPRYRPSVYSNRLSAR